MCAPRLNALEDVIAVRRVRLIVVDSIAALLRRYARTRCLETCVWGRLANGEEQLEPDSSLGKPLRSFESWCVTPSYGNIFFFFSSYFSYFVSYFHLWDTHVGCSETERDKMIQHHELLGRQAAVLK